ncbi:hypothetical protein [Legionella parisiensis]|uniref:hypothetical protein n=1 Tax=Legionella parisiensis TaxID=45071 RepID=UPI000ACC28CC|nr:hypothetical protein [Legionella parisiensis]
MTETYACQTCFIPITNYFRVFARLWLHISTRLICNQYISQYAPLIRPLSKLAAERQMPEGAERGTGVYVSVHGDSRNVSTPQLSSTFQKRSVKQGTCVRSVHTAMGSPKDHIAYCSIPDSTDLSPTCGEKPGVPNSAIKHTTVCSVARKIATSANNVEMSVNQIEPLRYFLSLILSQLKWLRPIMG